MSLSFTGVTVRYDRTAVVSAATATLTAGGMTALIGPNGAGKSSLLKAVAGLLPAQGEVLLEGRALAAAEKQGLIAYMPQDIGARSSLTLLEVVLLGRVRSLGLALPRDLIAGAEAALARFGLVGLQDRSLDAVSGGQRQLVYLAQAIFRAPRALLLDEPTAALDLRHQLVVLETVRAHARAQGVPVLFAMHDLSLAAQFADQVICLAEGVIDACGSAPEVMQAARLRRLYGVETEIARSESGHLRVTPLRAINAGSQEKVESGE